MSNDFLPPEHKEPIAASRYIKLSSGENTLRILSTPIMGYEYWSVNKEKKRIPVRVKTLEQVPAEVRQAPKSQDREKRFWMMVVLNKDSGLVQIFEATQASIRNKIVELTGLSAWGDPREYDILVKKTGSQLQTRYEVTPLSKEKLSPKITEMVKKELAVIDLEKVFSGESPFLEKE